MRQTYNYTLWDALLWRDEGPSLVNNLSLYITVKIYFIKEQPTRESDGSYKYHIDDEIYDGERWSDISYDRICNEVISLCTRHWDYKFWLHIPEQVTAYNYRVNQINYRPAISCRFRLVRVIQQYEAHFAFRMINATTAQGNSVNRESRTGILMRDSVRSTPIIRTNPNATSDQDSEIVLSHQTQCVHEMGHVLGMEHTCIEQPQPQGGRGNDHEYCIGIPDQTQAGNSRYSMAAGMELAQWEAFPWQKAMELITSAHSSRIRWNRWTPTTSSIRPEVITT